MRSSALASGVALSLACSLSLSCANKTRGIEIRAQLSADAAVDTLVLYLADPTVVDASAQLASSGSGDRLTTEIFARIDGPALTVDVTALADPTQAVFLLEPGVDGLGDRIPYAIVVGLRGGTPALVGTLTDLAAPNTEIAIYDLPLGLAAGLEAATSSGRGVELWGSDDPTAACVRVAATGAAGGSGTYVAVVADAGDPDCDGFTGPKECTGDELVYDGTQTGSGFTCDALQKATPHDGGSAAMTVQVCELGSRACTDGDADAAGMTCGRSAICAPLTLCAAADCADPASASCLAAAKRVVHLACTFFVGAGIPSGSPDSLCSVNSSAALPAIGGSELDAQGFLSDPTHTISETFSFPNGTSASDPLVVAADPTQEDALVLTNVTHAAAIGATGTSIFLAKVASGPTERSVAIPIIVTVAGTANCSDPGSAQARCEVLGATDQQVVGNDGLDDCVATDAP